MPEGLPVPERPPVPAPDPLEGLPRWGFAFPGPLRDELTRLALAGTKTTTAGLLVEMEADGEVVPAAGDRSVLVDSLEQPVAIVETVSCRVVRLADVDDRHAIDEGEGYANAAEFRASHERFWSSYLDDLRRRLGDPSFAITDDTPIVAERFRVVALVAGEGGGRHPATVRPALADDRPVVDAFLVAHGTEVVARLGELVDARRHPALIAEADGRLLGVLTWIIAGHSLEVLTLHAAERWQGVGTALLGAALRVAEAAGCRRLWLITTNDNTDALRFYQRRGFHLVKLHAGAVDRARATVKPWIPQLGDHGIPLQDELELELMLQRAGDGPGV
jgi:uncharacterized protein YhfF/N-acetylglutamate synthase-like GNAT family acetyltransferase